MIEVLPDSVGPSSTLSVPRSQRQRDIADGGNAVDRSGDVFERNGHVRPPASRKGLSSGARCAVIQSSSADISAADIRKPSLDRRHTISSAVNAHSDDIRYVTSLSVKLAPKDWPRSAIDFASPEPFGGAGAVGMRQPVGMRGREERIVAQQLRRQRRDRRDVHIAAGQRRFSRSSPRAPSRCASKATAVPAPPRRGADRS